MDIIKGENRKVSLQLAVYGAISMFSALIRKDGVKLWLYPKIRKGAFVRSGKRSMK